MAATGTTARIITQGVTLDNCQMQFGAVGQSLQHSSNGVLIWKNTPNALVGTIFPNMLLAVASARAFIEGCDFSALTGTKVLFGHSGSQGIAVFKNCRLGTGPIISTGALASASVGSEVILMDCDAGDNHYRNERYNFMGTQTVETTIIRVGGATDGTTPISWKIVTTADSETEVPFESLPIYVWNDTVGTAKTVTIEGIWGGGAVPLNTDIWLEAYAKTVSGFPTAAKVTNGRATPLDAGTNLPAGSGAWGGSTTKFSMAVTFTPAERGLITLYVKTGRPNSTFYIDPRPVVT
jgi:hypothetical protein